AGCLVRTRRSLREYVPSRTDPAPELRLRLRIVEPALDVLDRPGRALRPVALPDSCVVSCDLGLNQHLRRMTVGKDRCGSAEERLFLRCQVDLSERREVAFSEAPTDLRVVHRHQRLCNMLCCHRSSL